MTVAKKPPLTKNQKKKLKKKKKKAQQQTDKGGGGGGGGGSNDATPTEHAQSPGQQEDHVVLSQPEAKEEVKGWQAQLFLICPSHRKVLS